MMIGNKTLTVLLAATLAFALNPGVAIAAGGGEGLQTADAHLATASTKAGFTVTVRDLGVSPASGLGYSEGYASVIDDGGESGVRRCALADEDGRLLFEYDTGFRMFEVTDGVVTRYVDPAVDDISLGKAGHFNLDGTKLYDEDYDVVYPYSEGVAVVVNVEGHSARPGLCIIDKRGKKVAELGGPFGVPRSVGTDSTTDNYYQREYFLAGVPNYAMSVDGLIPFYVQGPSLPVGYDLASLTLDDMDASASPTFGFMNKKGKVVIPNAGRYFAANMSKSGRAVAAGGSMFVKEDAFYFIDRSGNRVIGEKYGSYVSCSGFSSSWVSGVSVLDGSPVPRYGYIDTDGKTIVPFKYDGAFGAGQYGLCTVGKRGGDGKVKYGLVTAADEVVVPLEWDDVIFKSGNVAYGVKGGKLFAIDIVPTARNVAGATITGLKAKAYTGKPLKQSPKVTIGKTALKVGRDYTLSYVSNVDVGTATVRVDGRGSFTGTATATFEVDKANVATATASKVKAQKFTGKALKPKPTLTYKGKVLERGSDYTLKFKDNKERGQATITVKGKGNFKGTKVVKFKIK